MAHLSTHVLDTSRGVPAKGLTIDLHRWEKDKRLHLKTVSTNSEGRTDAPLLSADLLEPGVYELTFHAGDYLRGSGASLTEPPFLDEVVIRFGLAEPGRNYHVPLLLSPYGYSTYRGS
jgi:5-hydroxyisourate hydrolase